MHSQPSADDASVVKFRGTTYDAAVEAAQKALGPRVKVLAADRIRRGGIGRRQPEKEEADKRKKERESEDTRQAMSFRRTVRKVDLRAISFRSLREQREAEPQTAKIDQKTRRRKRIFKY